ncbi:autotransporter assembly complex protein TamA [Alteromonas sp. ASW11-19]|uniref:Translocation and assembly module subunit TamA n=1 Tax=Alteromonas salexigens TaxID=2982530 RepID=A0ABT2VJX3_9ALTE|nr:autotransporter assembly complex family protein [Alteromonas salexigens]MCU7553565.1 autotransporter assembly complex protein TamA [Alteromonas salexigens]
MLLSLSQAPFRPHCQPRFCGMLFAVLLFLSSGAAWAVEFTVQGVEQDDIEDNILLHLNNMDVEPGLLADPFWQEEVAETVATAVEPYGYYNSDTLVEVSEDNEVILQVTLNQPLLVTNITREIIGAGRADEDFRERFNAFPLEKGQPLHQPTYSKYKSSMLNYALTHGYFDFAWQAARLDLVREEHAANVLLIAQSGPQYLFGEVKIVGDDKAEAIIRRLVPFEQGEKYSSTKLTEFNRSLSQSGYFSRVIARPVVSEAENLRVPIEVTVNHRPRDSFDVGVGAATDTGPRLRLGWERPWVNSRGHSVSADLFLSSPEQSLTTDYRIPMRDITRDYLSFQAGYQFIEYENSDTQSETLSLAAHRYWQKNNSPWQQDGSLTYLREQFEQGGEPPQTTTLVMPGYAIQYLQKDGDLNINNGLFFQAFAQVGRDNLGSDINIVKGVMEGKIIRTLNNVHRFTARAEVGAIKTNDFSQVPASLRFFAGGDTSVRGYQYRDISPTDDVFNPVTGEVSTQPIGGKYLATASVEYAYQFAESWRAAVFTDAGTATNDWGTTPFYSVGTGVHWISPIGPIRLYIAHNIDDRPEDWRLHFILGPAL